MPVCGNRPVLDLGFIQLRDEPVNENEIKERARHLYQMLKTMDSAATAFDFDAEYVCIIQPKLVGFSVPVIRNGMQMSANSNHFMAYQEALVFQKTFNDLSGVSDVDVATVEKDYFSHISH